MNRIFCLIILCLVNHIVLAQQVALDRVIDLPSEYLPLGVFLDKLSDAYELNLVYSENRIPMDQIVHVVANQEQLRAVLHRTLQQVGLTAHASASHLILKPDKSNLVQVVRGRVTEAHIGVGLPGATVRINSGSKVEVTASDENGFFRFDGIPVGRVTIQVTSIGFEDTWVRELLLDTGKELVLNIPVATSIRTIDEIVITGDKYSYIGESTSPSVIKLNSNEVNHMAGSLQDPARFVANTMSVTSPNDESNALIVRGNSPRGVLWMVGGLEVPNPNHFANEGSSSGLFTMLSPQAMGTSNFVSGAFAAPFGNALSAVFDINLKEGNNERGERYLSLGTMGTEIHVENPIKKSKSSIMLNYRYQSFALLDNMGIRDWSNGDKMEDFQDACFNVTMTNGRNTQMSFYGLGGRSNWSSSVGDLSGRYYSSMGLAGLVIDRHLTPNSFVSLSLATSGTNISGYERFSSSGRRIDEDFTKRFLRTALKYRGRLNPRLYVDAGSILTLLNYDFFLVNEDPGNTLYSFIINFGETGKAMIYQGYVSFTQEITTRLATSYGLHYMGFSLTNDHSLEPRASMSYELGNAAKLTLGYGKHSRIENLQYYLGRNHQVGGSEVKLNSRLAFTRAHHFVLGYSQRLSRDQLLDVQGYYQYLYNAPVQLDPNTQYITLNQESGFITDSLVNRGRGTNYGIEIGWSKFLSAGLNYSINGSIYQSQFQVQENLRRNTYFNGNYVFHGNIGKEFNIHRKKGRRLSISGRVTYAGGRRYTPIDLAASVSAGQTILQWDRAFEAQLPAYFRSDFLVDYHLDFPQSTMNIRLDIQNVTNYRNAAFYYFDQDADEVKLKRQIGIFPVFVVGFTF